jgi:hypothetical protein
MTTAREPKHRRTKGPNQAPRVQCKHQVKLNVPRVFRTTRGISVQGHQAPRVQASTGGISNTRVPKHHGNLIVPRVFRTTRNQIKYQGCKSTPNQAQGTKSSIKGPNQAPGDHIKHQGPRDQSNYQGSKRPRQRQTAPGSPDSAR